LSISIYANSASWKNFALGTTISKEYGMYPFLGTERSGFKGIKFFVPPANFFTDNLLKHILSLLSNFFYKLDYHIKTGKLF